MYQVRTLPNHRGFGLYFPGNDKEPAHWYGDDGYKSLTDALAWVFPTSAEARKFRATVLDDAPEGKYKESVNKIALATARARRK